MAPAPGRTGSEDTPVAFFLELLLTWKGRDWKSSHPQLTLHFTLHPVALSAAWPRTNNSKTTLPEKMDLVAFLP